MKKIILLNSFLILLIVQSFTGVLYAQKAELRKAEVEYQQKNYSGAVEIYEQVLKKYGESASVYYNLGNAYYKMEKVAPSILNYERALLLNPGDGDIRFNCQMAKQKAVDNITPVGSFFLVDWFKSIQNRGSVNSWGKLGIVSFILFIGCLALFFFSRWVRLKKIAFYLGIAMIVVVVFSNVFAHSEKNGLINHSYAIVFSPTVTVKSSPDASGTDLFILHEGAKVRVKSSLGSWSEIELEDGNVGWMPDSDFQKI